MLYAGSIRVVYRQNLFCDAALKISIGESDKETAGVTDAEASGIIKTLCNAK